MTHRSRRPPDRKVRCHLPSGFYIRPRPLESVLLSLVPRFVGWHPRQLRRDCEIRAQRIRGQWQKDKRQRRRPPHPIGGFVNQGQLDFASHRTYDSSTLSSSIVTISPSTALVVNGTVDPFFLRVRQNKSYLVVAASRTLVSSLIVTVERTSSGPIKVTVINTADSNSGRKAPSPA